MIDIKKILAESSDCEFKEMLEVKKPKSWLKTVSAFANECGGILIFGMRDDKTVVGLSDIKSVIDSISKILKEKIDPQPIVDFKPEKTKYGKDILILEISAGKDTPYYFSSDGNKIAFVRIGSDSQQASSNRLNELILKGRNLSFDQLTTDFKNENLSYTILNATFKRLKNINLELSDYKAFDICKTDGSVTNAGLLFSDECPLLQARLFCTHWDGIDKSGGKDDAIDDKEFSGDLISQLMKSHDFIKMNSKVRWKKMSNYRLNKPDYSDRAVFEALANAIMHRDYNICGSEIHVDMFDDRLEIYSPGGMPDGSLIQDKQIEKVDSIRRNPLIADIFHRLDFVERRGSGLKKICDEIANLYGYSDENKPIFESTKSTFRVIMKNMNYNLITMTDKIVNLTDKNQKNKDLQNNVTDKIDKLTDINQKNRENQNNMTDKIDRLTDINQKNRDLQNNVTDIIQIITGIMKVKLTKKEKSFITMLLPHFEENEWVTNTNARKITKLSEMTAKRLLRSLTEKKIFRARGDNKARQYKLNKSLKSTFVSDQEYRRVVFYSKDDLGLPIHFDRMSEVLVSEIKPTYEDINDIMELYHIKLYLDNEVYPIIWSEQEITTHKETVIKYNKIVYTFFDNINDENIQYVYDSLLFGYADAFWKLFASSNLIQKISDNSISNIINQKFYIIHQLLKHKPIVSKFKNTIRVSLLNNPQSAEIILEKYEIKKDERKKDINLPDNLTSDDHKAIILNYINYKEANSNYLDIIVKSKDIKISSHIKLKAKKQYEANFDKSNQKENVSWFNYEILTKYVSNIDRIKDIVYNRNSFLLCIEYIYSLDYIKQYKDNLTLFKNFITLFDFLDYQGRISLLSLKSDLSTLEKHIGIHHAKDYILGFTFTLKEKTSYLQIVSYHDRLSEIDIKLESVIIDFVKYLHEKLNLPSNVGLQLPLSGNTYFEKAKFIMPELESFLKRYDLFVENGFVDLDLFELETDGLSFKKLKSLIKNKYVYRNTEHHISQGCMNILFSDQSILLLIDSLIDKNYETFIDLIFHENVKIEDFQEYQKPYVIFLIENNLLKINEDNSLVVSNKTRVLILYDLYKNEVISFHHQSYYHQIEILKMIDEGILLFENSLFTRQEQSYFNFYLNAQEFTNGYQVRNRYAHGKYGDPDKEDEHKYAYFTFLKMIILALLKIEIDLMIYDFQKKNIN